MHVAAVEASVHLWNVPYSKMSIVSGLLLKPFRSAGDTTITPQPVGAAALPAQEAVETEEEAEPASAVIPPEEVDEALTVLSGLLPMLRRYRRR